MGDDSASTSAPPGTPAPRGIVGALRAAFRTRRTSSSSASSSSASSSSAPFATSASAPSPAASDSATSAAAAASSPASSSAGSSPPVSSPPAFSPPVSSSAVGRSGGAHRAKRDGRALLAAEHGWRYSRSGSGTGVGALQRRWRRGHAAALADLDPSEELTGRLGPEHGALPFTVFDTPILGGPHSSRRTVCVVHLPAALPPVAVIPDPANGEPCAEGRVGPVPPWAALGFQHPPELDGAPPPQHPAFADAIVTGEVLDLTRRLSLTGWRIAGPDLVWVSRPGPDGALPPDGVLAVLYGLAALARALPPTVIAHYAEP